MKHPKETFLKIVSLVLITLLISNPELVDIAIFIDAIGIDVFLLLIETQLIYLLLNRPKELISHHLEKIITWFRIPSESVTMKQYPMLLISTITGPALLMNFIAISFVAITLIIN